MSGQKQLIGQKQRVGQKKECQVVTYVCLEQPETLQYLNYLSLSNSGSNQQQKCSLNFNSEVDEGVRNNKKSKRFVFDGIYNRTEKLKFCMSSIIKQTVKDALKGKNQTFFIYGTQQKCKDKIIFGQSQNHGIFLSILSQLFDYCHLNGLQEQVTVKFCCSLFHKARFQQIFGNHRDIQISYSKDYIQGGILHNIPQIIIRNVKTGLKLLNIVLRHVYDLREQQFTQNLILTLKLQLDQKKQNEYTQVYCISKITFIKLANPSVNSSLKGINKNNIWFVNLFNYIQSSSINTCMNLPSNDQQLCGTISQNTKQNEWDQFTSYLIETCFKSSHKIFGFVSINNKMSSNQCLTALLFANYLKNCKLQSNFYLLDLNKLNAERQNYQNYVFNSETIKNSQKQLNLWAEYIDLLQSYINQYNYLQFQYSLVIGEACERLNKYIFTEQLEDFFYAKKINVQVNEDLVQTYLNVKKVKDNIKISQKKILEQINHQTIKINQQQYQQLKNKIQKLFQIQFSLAHHFLLQDFQRTHEKISILLNTLKQKKLNKDQSLVNRAKSIQQAKKQQNELKKNRQKYNELFKQKQKGKKGLKKSEQKYDQRQKIKTKQKENRLVTQNSRIQQNINQNYGTILNQSKINKKVINSIDNLQSMFKNKNVGYCSQKSKIIF